MTKELEERVQRLERELMVEQAVMGMVITAISQRDIIKPGWLKSAPLPLTIDPIAAEYVETIRARLETLETFISPAPKSGLQKALERAFPQLKGDNNKT